MRRLQYMREVWGLIELLITYTDEQQLDSFGALSIFDYQELLYRYGEVHEDFSLTEKSVQQWLERLKEFYAFLYESGWQEDFALFTHFPLPSQIKALEYFEHAAARFDGRFILGGHSKGGNLAVYAAAFSEQALRGRIDAVYSMDGPGFERENLENSAFDEIRGKIHTFVPQSSVFGMLLEHREHYTVIQSDRKGFMQHDIYSWSIDRTEPVTLPKTTATSAFFDHTITDFFDGMSRSDRVRLADGVFEVLKSADVMTFDEMLERLMHSIGKGLDTMKNMDGTTRALIMKQVGRLVKSAGRNLNDVNPLRRKNRLSKEERERLKLDKRRFKHEKKLREITGEAGS